MKFIRIQTYQDPEDIADLRLYAQEKGISVAAAIRQAVEEFKEKPTVKRTLRQKFRTRKTKNSLLDLIGCIKGAPADMASNVDEIYRID
jgi:hypothetical protein